MFLNLIAPINPLGYGVVGRNVLGGLVEAGHTVSYYPLGGKIMWESDIPFVHKCLENAKMFNPEAPSIRIWHQNDMAMFPGGGPRIGWPIFELNKFDDQERLHLSSVDRLFVCSEWAKKVLEEEGIADEVDRIDVVPLGIDPGVFYRDEEAREKRGYWTRKKTVFLNIGKWEVRKGHNELLEAFCKAFKPEDPVELWMINHNDFIKHGNELWKTKYISSPMGANIKILPRIGSQHELRQIINTADWGVFPSHAEGWNLEPLEFMACGVPSIVTDYSGHTEYLNESNSLLVETNGMEPAQDGIWFHGQGEWCTYDVDKLVEAMQAAHDYKQSGSNALDEGMKATAEKFTWANTVKRIEEVL